ncbi:unnamed protein product [Didymodactylos carnosus]|uniref:Uncharacterized protein n=1 Tax=Didymodactylos carnosus TaxID=1234261 RepID=A0A815VS39_9BILA|nr:unnamed protein product [Didymodactylos carnosus]CAF4393731.1 unnamed protein product [Didymodactylos carnosus]
MASSVGLAILIKGTDGDQGDKFVYCIYKGKLRQQRQPGGFSDIGGFSGEGGFGGKIKFSIDNKEEETNGTDGNGFKMVKTRMVATYIVAKYLTLVGKPFNPETFHSDIILI